MTTLKSLKDLQEALIIPKNQGNYGTVIIAAGGAGSGKGFAISNYIDTVKYKIIDVDQFKSRLITLARIKDPDSALAGLDLSNPSDVVSLHQYVKDRGLDDKYRDLIFKSVNDKNRLPNIVFDVTLKSMDTAKELVGVSLKAGYRPENIHILWVLTDYQIAIKQNSSRDRIVPDDILLMTHAGAANTVTDIIRNGLPGLNGFIKIVLRNGMVTYPSSVNASDRAKAVVRKFDYITVKPEGKPVITKAELARELATEILAAIPRTTTTTKLVKDLESIAR